MGVFTYKPGSLHLSTDGVPAGVGASPAQGTVRGWGRGRGRVAAAPFRLGTVLPLCLLDCKAEHWSPLLSHLFPFLHMSSVSIYGALRHWRC
jgi:hypothetical protein